MAPPDAPYYRPDLALVHPHGVEVRVGTSFGTETLPAGLRTLIGRRPSS